MANVVLSFPKDRCKEITVKEVPFIQVDVGMSAEQLILYLMQYSVSDDKIGIVCIGTGDRTLQDSA